MASKYYCKAFGQKIEITREQFMQEEAANGFHSKFPGRPATGGFSRGGNISYTVEHVPGTPYLDD